MSQSGLGLRNHVVTIATPGVLDVVSVWVDMDDPVMMKSAEEALEVMQRVMAENDRALGISAIQVGVALRVMACRINRCDLRQISVMYNPMYEVVTIHNPGIAEGCLSVPGIQMNISRRASEIKAQWTDPNRKEHTETLTGLAAVLFQHEVDHMNGKTIIDGASRQVRREAYKQATKGGSR